MSEKIGGKLMCTEEKPELPPEKLPVEEPIREAPKPYPALEPLEPWPEPETPKPGEPQEKKG